MGGGGRSARSVRPFENDLNLTIIDPTTTTPKIHGFEHIGIFGTTKVGVVGPAQLALCRTGGTQSLLKSNLK